MWLLVLTVLGGVAMLLLVGFWNHAQIIRDWEMALEPWADEAHARLAARAEGERRMSDLTYARAEQARARGATDEAVRLLDVGLRLAEKTAPDWVTLLRGMCVVSRTAAAVAPLPPLRWGDFRLWRVGGFAFGETLLGQLLVTSAERFQLRTYMLRRGFVTTVRFLAERTAQVRGPRRADRRSWDHIAAARKDLGTLSNESVVSFTALLLSLSARRRAAASTLTGT